MLDKFDLPKKREYADNVVTIVESTINEAVQYNGISSLKLSDLNTYKEIQALKKNEIIDLIYLSFDVYVDLLSQDPRKTNGWITNYAHPALYILQLILSQNIRKTLPYTDNDLAYFLFFTNEALNRNIVWIPQNSILGAIEKKYKETIIPAEIIRHINECKRIAEINSHTNSAYKNLEKRAQKLLDRDSGLTVVADHNWSKVMIDDLNKMPTAENEAWLEILTYSFTATSSKPSKKWLKNMLPLIKKLEFANYKYYIERWFALIAKEKIEDAFSDNDLPLSNETNRTIIKGLIWSTLANPHEDLNRYTKNLGLYCYKKIPGWGAISPKIGNACIYVLGELPSLQSINALNEMLKKIKYPSAKTLIEKSLDSAAERHGLTRDDLDELSTPTFGFLANSTSEHKISDVIAVISIKDAVTIDLSWKKTDGSTQKSPPKHIKDEYSQEITDIKKKTKEIRTTLETQKWRLEKLFHRFDPWLFYDWKQRYHEQPLIKHMVRSLIWVFETDSLAQSGIWYEDKFISHNQEEINFDENTTSVKLWHPSQTNAAEITAWRAFLYEQRIRQPFKQAYREFYKTNNKQQQPHSTQFASHILKQHNLHALCRQRGWKYELQGDFDSEDTASINFDQYNIAAEFTLDREDHPLTDMGICKYLTTDRLRFFQDNIQIPLSEVFPVILSEVMRDVDLFTSVCSIGNDQLDSHDTQLHEYWHNFVFDTKSPQRISRQEMLVRVLPKFDILENCSINGNFLNVPGKLNSYQIHLSSGNVIIDKGVATGIQMLDIPDNITNKDKLFIPYDDDLIFIIINKAILLSNDDKIEDKNIRNQLFKKP